MHVSELRHSTCTWIMPGWLLNMCAVAGVPPERESVAAAWGFLDCFRLTSIVVRCEEAADPSSAGQYDSSRVLSCMVQDPGTNARQRSGWIM